VQAFTKVRGWNSDVNNADQEALLFKLSMEMQRGGDPNVIQQKVEDAANTVANQPKKRGRDSSKPSVSPDSKVREKKRKVKKTQAAVATGTASPAGADGVIKPEESTTKESYPAHTDKQTDDLAPEAPAKLTGSALGAIGAEKTLLAKREKKKEAQKAAMRAAADALKLQSKAAKKKTAAVITAAAAQSNPNLKSKTDKVSESERKQKRKSFLKERQKRKQGKVSRTRAANDSDDEALPKVRFGEVSERPPTNITALLEKQRRFMSSDDHKETLGHKLIL